MCLPVRAAANGPASLTRQGPSQSRHGPVRQPGQKPLVEKSGREQRPQSLLPRQQTAPEPRSRPPRWGALQPQIHHSASPRPSPPPRHGRRQKLRPGGHGMLMHGFEHLGGQDDRLPDPPSRLHDPVLGGWDFRQIKFSPKIASGNHESICCGCNLVQPVHGPNGFNLCNQLGFGGTSERTRCTSSAEHTNEMATQWGLISRASSQPRASASVKLGNARSAPGRLTP